MSPEEFYLERCRSCEESIYKTDSQHIIGYVCSLNVCTYIEGNLSIRPNKICPKYLEYKREKLNIKLNKINKLQ